MHRLFRRGRNLAEPISTYRIVKNASKIRPFLKNFCTFSVESADCRKHSEWKTVKFDTGGLYFPSTQILTSNLFRHVPYIYKFNLFLKCIKIYPYVNHN